MDHRLTVEEAAELAGVSTKTLRRAYKAKPPLLRAIQPTPNGRVWIVEADLRAWLNRSPEPPRRQAPIGGIPAPRARPDRGLYSLVDLVDAA
jgi:hypothetical protein